MDTSSTTQRPKSWAIIEDLVVPLERSLYGHPHAGLLRETQFEEGLLELGRRKSTKLGMSVCSSKTRIIFSVNVDDVKNGWKEAEHGHHVEEIVEKCGS